MKYFQCDLEKGTGRTTAWIEARGAKVGASVELKDLNEFWVVKQVYSFGIEYEDLKAKQERDRNSLPSLVKA